MSPVPRRATALVGVALLAVTTLAACADDPDSSTPQGRIPVQTLTTTVPSRPAGPFRWHAVDRRTGLRYEVRQHTRNGREVPEATLTVTVTSKTPERTRRELGAAPTRAIGCERRSGGGPLVTYQRPGAGGPAPVGTRYVTDHVSVPDTTTFREDLDFCQLFLGGPTGTTNVPFSRVDYEPQVR